MKKINWFVGLGLFLVAVPSMASPTKHLRGTYVGSGSALEWWTAPETGSPAKLNISETLIFHLDGKGVVRGSMTETIADADKAAPMSACHYETAGTYSPNYNGNPNYDGTGSESINLELIPDGTYSTMCVTQQTLTYDITWIPSGSKVCGVVTGVSTAGFGLFSLVGSFCATRN